MASIHCYLMSTVQSMFDDPVESIAFGPSTTNDIERWWRDLNVKVEKYFIEHCCYFRITEVVFYSL